MKHSEDIHVDLSRRRTIFDVVQSFIGLISTNGILLDANKSALDFIGCDLKDVVGRPFAETPWWKGCNASRAELEEAIRRGLAGESSRFEVRLTGRDSQIIDADFSITPVRNGAGKVVFLAPEARDISEVKESRAALSEARARLMLAYEAADIGTWDLDLATNDLYWSDRQYELFDVPKESDKTSFESAISRIHPDDRDRVVDATLSAVRANRPFRDEFRIVRRNGEVRWIFGQGRPIRPDNDGAPQAMTGVNYDITDRKDAEIELAQTNEELEARVAERTRELEQEMRERHEVREALAHSQRLDAIGQLAGGLAHDFNNLLAVIGGNLELVAAKMPDDSTAGMIEDALNAVEAGANLNQRLLSFARKTPLNARVISVNERVEHASGLLERTLDENISLELQLANDIHMTRVDPGEFDSALLNLVINSRDAMPSGGSIRIESANQTFSEDDLKKNPSIKKEPYVRVSVSDTGGGMSTEVLEKAMTPFFTTKDLGQGSGLGLSSVFGFARQSGGFVTIESVEGEGTSVHIYLPRTPLTTDDVPAHEAGSLPVGRGEVILAVEDDEAVLRLTRRRLLALGYRVAEATSAAGAIERLEAEETVSLVFTDIRMPGALSGYDLAEWIATHRPEVRVVLSTGYSDREDYELDAVSMLRKPYSMRSLADTLSAALK